MIGIIATAGSFLFKLIGGHLFGGGVVGKIEQVAVGLGFRFAAGFVTAFYFFNDDFRKGADQCIKAVVGTVF